MYRDVIFFIVCDFLSNRPDHLSCHVKHVHSTERPFKCQVTVRLHMPLALLHSQSYFMCASLVYRTPSTYWFVFLSLQACTSAFATKDRLRSHMIRHEGKVTCNICGKMLSAAYITSHLKTHGQSNYNNVCNKGKCNMIGCLSQSANQPVVYTITVPASLGDSCNSSSNIFLLTLCSSFPLSSLLSLQLPKSYTLQCTSLRSDFASTVGRFLTLL